MIGPKRGGVLPAEIYDALKASVESCGGVGSGRTFRVGNRTPLCIHGHAEVVDGNLPFGKAVAALYRIGITTYYNDITVQGWRAVSETRALMPWDAYIKATGIERAAL